MARGTVLVTGSAGHLGEALVRVLRSEGSDVVGLDVLDSPFTTVVGSVADRGVVRRCLDGVDAVVHTATLHKPHIETHDRQAFIDTNITGTGVLLDEAGAAGVGSFVFTSSTSVFGHALTPAPGCPAVWVTEELAAVPRNIYGETKQAAEDLCRAAHDEGGLPVVVMRVSRFFPESDDDGAMRSRYDDANLKANEYLYRRVDIEDAVRAFLLALDRGPAIGFGAYVVSATTPFGPQDAIELARDAPSVVRRLFPDQEEQYRRRNWRMLPSIDRVYVNARARRELGWTPTYDFRTVLDRLMAGEDLRSPLARSVGAKGYHR